MSAKQLMPNQCDILHPIYGVHDCCLCNSRMANSILKEDIVWLLKNVKDNDYCTANDMEYFDDRIKLIKDRYLKQGV